MEFDVIASGATRLAALSCVVTGVAVLVRRTGMVDLSAGATAAAGAYLGPVTASILGLPPWSGLLSGAAAGAAVGFLAAAVAGRVGRLASSLSSLSMTVAAVALAAALGSGGVAGFHAVPFLTGGEAGDAGVALLMAALVAVATARWWRSRSAAAAAVAVHEPHVPAAFGRRGWLDAGVAGAVGGSAAGVGGALVVTWSGSAAPGAFDIRFAVAALVAGLVGGAPPIGPVLGTVLVWGPATVFPLVPVIGDAPPLLAMGPIALAVLALRQGRPLVSASTRRRRPTATSELEGPTPAAGSATALSVPRSMLGLSQPGRILVRPGEVLTIAGPNGAGKSTALGRLGGQLPDGGDIRVGDRTAPRGARHRFDAGIARSWQHPPRIPAGDMERIAIHDGHADARAQEARRLLATTAPGIQQLTAVAATGAPVILLDEPGAGAADDEAAARFIRWLADSGSTVVVADHRPAVLAVADQVVDLPGQAVPRVETALPPGIAARPEVPGTPRLTVTGPGGVDLELGAGSVTPLDAPSRSRHGDAFLDALVTRRAGWSVRVDGQDVSRTGTARRVRAGLVRVDVSPVAADVTIRDHLAGVPGLSSRAVDHALAVTPRLAGRGHQPAGILSGGERLVLAWLRAALARPAVVVLDAAGTGLDEEVLTWASRLVSAWRAGGAALVVRVGRPEEHVWVSGPS